MIVKKIDRHPAQHSGDHARNVALLVDYMRQPDKDSTYAEALLRYLQEEGVTVGDAERLYHLGSRNFVCEGIQEQRAEMMAGANAAVRSPNPLTHWLLSWREHERPTPAQIDEAVELFLTYMQLGDHQAIYAAHTDTHNTHCHIAVNRYDLVRGRMKRVHNNWDLKAAHRAVALIVHRQGWEAEKGAGYKVVGNRIVRRTDAERGRSPDDVSIDQGAVNYETRTGLKSAQRIAVEEAAVIMLKAGSWPQLHFRLAAIGAEFIVKSSGALLKIGDQHVKASSAHRNCSFGKLEKRLGPFKERMASVTIASRCIDGDVMPEAIGANEFKNAREQHGGLKAQALADAKSDRDAVLQKIMEQSIADRDDVERLSDGGRSPERRLLLRLIKEKEERAQTEAQLAHKERCRRIREEQKQAADLERWLREQRAHYLADRWRNRNRISEWVTSFNGSDPSASPFHELEGYVARDLGQVRLWAKPDQDVAFVEWQQRVELAAGQNDEALLVAFKLAVVKFGRVTLNGSEDFKDRAARVIAAAGMENSIDNPELCDLLLQLKPDLPAVSKIKMGDIKPVEKENGLADCRNAAPPSWSRTGPER